MNHPIPTPPVLQTNFTNVRVSFRDDAQYQSEAAERDKRRRYADILKQENEEYDERARQEAARRNAESGQWFKEYHDAVTPSEKRTAMREYARRRGWIKSKEYDIPEDTREKVIAELHDIKLARLWFPAIVPTLRAKKLAEL